MTDDDAGGGAPVPPPTNLNLAVQEPGAPLQVDRYVNAKVRSAAGSVSVETNHPLAMSVIAYALLIGVGVGAAAFVNWLLHSNGVVGWETVILALVAGAGATAGGAYATFGGSEKKNKEVETKNPETTK